MDSVPGAIFRVQAVLGMDGFLGIAKRGAGVMFTDRASGPFRGMMRAQGHEREQFCQELELCFLRKMAARA